MEAGDLRARQGALRAREARVPVHARHAGRRHGGPDLVRQGEARRRRASREAWEWQPGAQLEADRREDRRDRPRARSPSRSPRPGAAHSTAAASGRCPGAFEISEDDEKLTFTMNPCGSGQRLVRNGRYGARRLGRHRLRPRLVLRPRGLPALLHPLRVHERAGADQLDRLPGLSLSSRPRTSSATPASGTGTRTRPTSPTATGSATGLSAAGPDGSGDEAEPTLAAGVRAVLAELGEDPGELALSPIPGGASRETWLVEGDGGPLGAAPRPEGLGLAGADGARSSRSCSAPRDAGVPVPEPLAFEPDGGRFGSPGMLMAFVEGTSVAPRILRKPEYERPAAPHGAARRGAGPGPRHSSRGGSRACCLPRRRDPVLAQIEEWERQLDEIGEPLPAVELGLRWLRANAPEPVRAAARPRRLPARQLHRRRATAWRR